MRLSIKWGLVLGLSICIWTGLLHHLGYYTTDLRRGTQADRVALVLPIAALFFAIRERRRQSSDGSLTIGQALATGIGTGLVSVPISAAGLWVYHHHVNPRWLDYVIAFEQAQAAAAGASSAQLAAKEAALRASGTDAAQLTGALVGTIILSTILSLIFAILLRRRPPSGRLAESA